MNAKLFGLLAAACTASGCTNAGLEVRVAGLEARVAQLETDVAALRTSDQGLPAPVDVTVPPGTVFAHTIDFEEGDRDFRAGDDITITEVRGTSSDISVGTRFLVRGRYQLVSYSSAVLALTVTATYPEGHTTASGRRSMRIARGSGDFELATTMAYEGHPHVTFGTGGKTFGGVYFGKGPTLLRDKGYRYE